MMTLLPLSLWAVIFHEDMQEYIIYVIICIVTAYSQVI